MIPCGFLLWDMKFNLCPLLCWMWSDISLFHQSRKMKKAELSNRKVLLSTCIFVFVNVDRLSTTDKKGSVAFKSFKINTIHPVLSTYSCIFYFDDSIFTMSKINRRTLKCEILNVYRLQRILCLNGETYKFTIDSITTIPKYILHLTETIHCWKEVNIERKYLKISVLDLSIWHVNWCFQDRQFCQNWVFDKDKKDEC